MALGCGKQHESVSENENMHDSQQIRLAYRERASMLLLLPPAVSLPTYSGGGGGEEKEKGNDASLLLHCIQRADISDYLPRHFCLKR